MHSFFPLIPYPVRKRNVLTAPHQPEFFEFFFFLSCSFPVFTLSQCNVHYSEDKDNVKHLSLRVLAAGVKAKQAPALLRHQL